MALIAQLDFNEASAVALREEQLVLGISTDPILKSLHGDARWHRTLESLGLAPRQVRDIEL